MAWNDPDRRPMFSDRPIEIKWSRDVADKAGKIDRATYEHGDYDESWEGWRALDGTKLWPNFRWRYAQATS